SGTGTISCSIASNDLTCTASGGTVIIGATTGTFGAKFSATPTATGTFANPRSGGVCSVDPNGNITESNEGNNACSNTVNVLADLTATKTNDAGGAVLPGTSFNWTVTVANPSANPASFASGQTILTDNLPNTNISYGSASAVNAGGTTGTVNCTIATSN